MADSAGSPMQVRRFRRSEEAPRPHLAWGGLLPDLGGRDARRKRSRTVLPTPEVLEDRVTPSTFLVTSTLDPSGRLVSGSLRWAIAQANRSRQPAPVVEITSTVQGGATPGRSSSAPASSASARA